MEENLQEKDEMISKLKEELEQVKTENTSLEEKVNKWTHATILKDEIISKQKRVTDKTCIGYGDDDKSDKIDTAKENTTPPIYGKFVKATNYNAVPPQVGTVTPPKPDVCFTLNNQISENNKNETSDSDYTEYASCISDYSNKSASQSFL